ncbi:universal stress protein [Lyngbya aestuarii]|uniref:universal stress protein n=1 Tax=Lyngbya aestuarii TaxID=118322 RepID=UPI00403DEF5D
MFQKILVAFDNSSNGQAVFEQALSLAKLTGASLMLLHVLSEGQEGAPQLASLSGMSYYPGLREDAVINYRKQWEAFENKCLEQLRSLTAQASTAGVSTEFTQSVGEPGHRICELASNWQADLIFVGRRGHSGLQELFLGSVSNYVLHHAPCSVFIKHSQTIDNSQVSSEKEVELTI